MKEHKTVLGEEDILIICAKDEIKSLERKKQRACKELEFEKGVMYREIQNYLKRFIRKRRKELK